jgi:hypothetical protein
VLLVNAVLELTIVLILSFQTIEDLSDKYPPPFTKVDMQLVFCWIYADDYVARFFFSQRNQLEAVSGFHSNNDD